MPPKPGVKRGLLPSAHMWPLPRCTCASCDAGRAASIARLGPPKRPDYTANAPLRRLRTARRAQPYEGSAWHDHEPHVAEVEAPLSLNVEES